MSLLETSNWREMNFVAIKDMGALTVSSKSLTANNTTAVVPIFTVTGQVKVTRIYGIVTTTIVSNCTATHWRLNDGSVQTNITLSSGTNISTYTEGSFIGRIALAATAIGGKISSQCNIQDPAAATSKSVFQPFIAGQAVGGATTNIEFVYTTTDTPITGAIDFYLRWVPIAPNSYVTAL